MRKHLAIAGLIGLVAIPLPASAQVDAFFGIMNQVIQEGARQQQFERERALRQQGINREREIRQREVDRRNEAQIALVRRAQSALKELGFYTMAIDGSAGPGTRRAVSAYLSAFNLPDRPLQESDVVALERRAAAGFRSQRETQEAQARGFSNRSDMQAADAAGFQNGREWENARRAGVDTYEQWRAFGASGFSTYQDYADARRRGFATRRALDAAERDGFDTADEHRIFIQSGAPDREVFDRQRERYEAAGVARDECVAAVSQRDWPRAAPRCRQAALVIRDDDALLAARATAERQLDLLVATTRVERRRLERDLEMAKDALALAEADLDNLDQGSAEDVRDDAQASRDRQAAALEGLAQELADTDATLERAERGRVRASCFGDAEEGRWSAAVASCAAALSADPSDRESAEFLARAEEQKEVERQRAEEQRRAIALANARRESEATIATLDAFASSGGAFQNGLGVSRAVVNLKAALDQGEPEALLQTQGALADLLAGEQSFQDFRQAKLAAERAAEASALTQAEENARRLEAFIRDHLTRNVLSPHAAELLTIQAELEDALRSDDSDRIVREQAGAQMRLDSLGLSDASRAFTLAPRVAATTLREQDARAAQTQLTLATARERAAALLAEIEDFVESGARFDAAIPVARAIGALRGQREGLDIAGIEVARQALEDALGAEAPFVAFRTRRAEAGAVAASDGAVTAAARLELKRAFIEAYIAENPLALEADTLLAAHAAITDALEAAAPAGLALTLAEKREQLSELGLMDAFARHAAMVAPEPTESIAVARSPGGLAITALNAALLDGDPRDVLILRNVSNGAPHLRLNLRGDPVFEGRRAQVCWMHEPPPPTLSVDLALLELRKSGGQLLMGGRRCDPAELLKQDLVLLERGRFLQGDVLAAQALVQRFEAEDLRPFAVISWENVAEESAAQEAFLVSLREELAAGARDGVGLIALPERGDALCIVDEGGDEHSVALNAHLATSVEDRIALHSPIGRRRIQDNAERSYARAMRGECGAVMAAGASLNAFLAGFARDGLRHRLTPIWFEADHVEQARQAVIARDEERLRDLAAMRQNLEGRALLLREQRATAEARRQARETDLRSTYAQEARAAFNDLQEGAFAIIDDSSVANRPHSLFPRFAEWRREQISGGWEFSDRHAELLDFGLADWEGRRLEGIVIRLHLTARNPALGAYQERCLVLGYLIDAEFGYRRDAFETDCSGAANIVDDWRSGRRYASRWIAALEE